MPIIKSDQDLIKSYLSGNETAFEILIAKHKDKVFAFILSKIKNYKNLKLFNFQFSKFSFCVS